MGTNTLTPTAAAATLSSVSTQNRNLSTDPERMAVIKVWDLMRRSARKCCEEQGFVTVRNVDSHTVGLTGACENTDTLFTLDWYDNKRMFLPQSNQFYIEMLTQAVEDGRVCGESQRFRKELKAAGRRLAQFIRFEIEHLGDLLGHLAGIVHSAAREVAIKCARKLALFGRDPLGIIDLTFQRKTYEEASELPKLNLSKKLPERSASPVAFISSLYRGRCESACT